MFHFIIGSNTNYPKKPKLQNNLEFYFNFMVSLIKFVIDILTKLLYFDIYKSKNDLSFTLIKFDCYSIKAILIYF